MNKWIEECKKRNEKEREEKEEKKRIDRVLLHLPLTAVLEVIIVLGF